MTAQKVMDRTAVIEHAGGATAQHRKGRLFPKFSTVFAVVALLLTLAAGFAVTRFLGSDIADISIGAALAVLYVALVILVDRVSIRRQQAGLPSSTEQMREDYDSIVAVLCGALDLRDNVAQGHARRISEIASVVAWQIGLRKEQVRQIEKAAILHDIGKIGLAEAVLAKPGPLDDSEWTEMKRHPELGCKILASVEFLCDAADVVYAHHERFDGSGYPRRLKGEEIPLGARIFAVVDAYNAMTSHRPYRKVMPHRKAVEEIVRNSGSQFDPEVVRAFLETERQGLLVDESWDGQRGLRTAAARGEAPAASPVGD